MLSLLHPVSLLLLAAELPVLARKESTEMSSWASLSAGSACASSVNIELLDGLWVARSRGVWETEVDSLNIKVRCLLAANSLLTNFKR